MSYEYNTLINYGFYSIFYFFHFLYTVKILRSVMYLFNTVVSVFEKVLLYRSKENFAAVNSLAF